MHTMPMNYADITGNPGKVDDTAILVNLLEIGAWDYKGLRQTVGDITFNTMLGRMRGMTDEIKDQILTGHDFKKKKEDQPLVQ